MGADYIPERDVHAAVWMKHFALGLVENPETYQVTPALAEQIDTLVQAFRLANARSWSPSTRTTVPVLAKNTARKAAEQLIRPTAQGIRKNPQITAADKIEIGLLPPGKRRRRVGPPVSVPRLVLTAEMSGAITIGVRDSISDRRARPAGAIGIELYQHVQPYDAADWQQTKHGVTLDAPGGPASDWRFIGMHSALSITHWPAVNHMGDQLAFVARWVTRRGEVGAFGNVYWTGVVRMPLKKGTLHQRGDRSAA